MRMERYELLNNVIVINDVYNVSLMSMKVVIDILSVMKG